jgi:hypothetical protein
MKNIYDNNLVKCFAKRFDDENSDYQPAFERSIAMVLEESGYLKEIKKPNGRCFWKVRNSNKNKECPKTVLNKIANKYDNIFFKSLNHNEYFIGIVLTSNSFLTIHQNNFERSFFKTVRNNDRTEVRNNSTEL